MTGRLSFFHRSGRLVSRTDHIPQVWRSGTSRIDENSASRFYIIVPTQTWPRAACTVYYQDGRSPRAPTARTSRTRRGGPASGSCAAGRSIYFDPTRDDTLLLWSWACRVLRAVPVICGCCPGLPVLSLAGGGAASGASTRCCWLRLVCARCLSYRCARSDGSRASRRWRCGASR